MTTSSLETNIFVKGKKIVSARIVLPSGDQVQMEDATSAACGMIWRPNAALAKKTGGETTHQLYADAYRLLRAGLHIRDRYGIRQPNAASEYTDVTLGIEQAREIVEAILHLNACPPEKRRWFLDMQRALVSEYGRKQDGEKQATAQHFRRALEAFEAMLDATQQKTLSRPQAAMVAGAGIRHLQRRLDAVASIANRMDRRTWEIYRIMSRTMGLYHSLWDLLRETGYYLATSERRERFRYYLTQFGLAIDQVKLRPFRRNAFQVARDAQDLQGLLQSLGGRQDAEIREAVERLRNGMRWMFVVDAVQRDIVIPLSLARAGLQKGRGELPPATAQKLEAAIAQLPKRLERCRDQDLRTPVREPVGSQIALARSHFAARDWRQCIDSLDRVSDLILRSPHAPLGMGFFVFAPFG